MLHLLPRPPRLARRMLPVIRPRALARARTAPDGTPAWLSSLGLAVGQWGEITGTNLSAVPPSPVPAGSTGPSSKIVAWTSFAAVGNKVFAADNGGHADYAGNEVNLIDFDAASPAWSEVLAPTASGDVVTNATHYSDGRPSSRHTYYGVVPDADNNRIMIVDGLTYGSPGAGGLFDAYNISGNNYSAAGTFANPPGTMAGAATWCDSATGDIYRASGWNLHKWTRASNTWSQPISGVDGVWGDGSASAFDSTRGRALILDSATSAAFTHAAGATAYVARTLTGADAAQVLGVGEMGMVYVAAIDKFLVRKAASGGTVYQIDPATFAVSQFTTTGGASVPATINGPYNKFLALPALGIVVYFPTYTGNAWALRVV